VVVGGASGIGREVAHLAALRGAHVFVADRNSEGAAQVAMELGSVTSTELTGSTTVDIRSRESIRTMLDAAALAFGGIDILINTAALFPATADGVIPDDMWGDTLAVNVTANYLLADEAATLFEEQGLHGNIVFTSSANAVVAKRGSEAYDVSKAALSHLIRELAVSMAPNVRVNGISPATVVKGSTMFGRDRLRASLTKYNIPFRDTFSDEELRSRLAAFYAERTLTNKAIDPADCAEAILFLASPRARCTTGHVIPVDGGLTEAFQR
jgi:NAD(P)-dependent dehydrogenase (short-subunit alcohol dehydrogenase family)